MTKYHHPVLGCDGNGQCHPGCKTRLRAEARRNDPAHAAKLENLKRLAIQAAIVDDTPPDPGTELKKLLASLGILGSTSCDCDNRIAQMQAWGVKGCQQNRDLIIEWMRAGQGQWGWAAKLKAGVLAVTTGLAFRLDWSDPFPSLVDEAIRRALPRFLPVTTRDLIYHIYPMTGNGAWQWNVRQLLRRIGLFNGKRIVTIATDIYTDPVESVVKTFEDSIDEFLIVPNRQDRADSVAYIDMLERVQSDDPQRAVMFGHAKSVTKSEDFADRKWTEALYETYLDYWPVVDEQLRWRPLAGSFRSNWKQWPDDSAAAWFYSGSWVWYRSAALFKTDWRKIDEFMFAVEPYPAIHFPITEAGVIAIANNTGTPYDLKNWDCNIQGKLNAFYAANAGRRTTEVGDARKCASVITQLRAEVLAGPDANKSP